MKMKILTALVAASITGSAFAAPILAQSGFYVNGEAGWSVVDAPGFFPVNIPFANPFYSQAADNYVWGGTLGYDYALTSNWMIGIEVGYVNMGYTSYNFNLPLIGSGSGTIKSAGTQVLLTATYVMPTGFDVFGKIGGIHQTTTSSFVGIFPSSSNEIKTIPALAIGAGYWFTQNLNVMVQYEHTFGSDWNFDFYSGQQPSGPMTQDIFSAGLTYKIPV